MRKFFCLVLVLALSAGLLLSAAAEQGNEGNPPSKAGTLFLTDEKITFSVVGVVNPKVFNEAHTVTLCNIAFDSGNDFFSFHNYNWF